MKLILENTSNGLCMGRIIIICFNCALRHKIVLTSIIYIENNCVLDESEEDENCQINDYWFLFQLITLITNKDGNYLTKISYFDLRELFIFKLSNLQLAVNDAMILWDPYLAWSYKLNRYWSISLISNKILFMPVNFHTLL